MKKVFLSFIVLLIAVIGIFSCAVAQTEGERIERFEAVIQVNSDRSVTVTETVTYTTGGSEKHGIYRDIRQYSSEGKKMEIGVISVVDEAGRSYQWQEEDNTADVRIRIGDPNTTFRGEKTYILTYTATHAVASLKDIDEIYWNATGNAWQYSIDVASATIVLPAHAPVLAQACYVGVQGSTAPCKIDNGIFRTVTPLQPTEGLTVAVGFSKGVVDTPGMQDNVKDFLRTYAIIVFPLIAFVVMFFVWLGKGKDPKGRGIVVPEYEIPEAITPLEAAVILRQHIAHADISAELIYLARRGFLVISRTEQKAFLGTNMQYTLVQQRGSGTLSSFDEKLLQAVFGNREQITLAELNGTFYKKIEAIETAAIHSVIAKGYFVKNPETVQVGYWAAGFGVGMGLVIISTILAIANSFTMFGSIAAAFIVILFGKIMPKVTKRGAEVRERLLGLKQYITVAEKERINFHNAPEKNPAHFEILLPFAMIFGAEKAWAKQFEGMYIAPSWFRDTTGNSFSPTDMVRFTDGFNTSFVSSATPPRSSSGGSSGSGFSGGGGGGGGGGSW